MDSQKKALFARYAPHIYQDLREPFPVRFLGCTAFTEKQPSQSFPKWAPDPAAEGAEIILEYAVYFDYDIQHLYDLEHIWVGVDAQGKVNACWCSFHGMRLLASGVPGFRLEGEHPVLYSQPGKHAMLPNPELFGLHPDFRTACGPGAGGGLLVPAMFADVMASTQQLDEKIRCHIRQSYAFTPSLEFQREILVPEQFISWPELKQRIPQLVAQQIAQVESV